MGNFINMEAFKPKVKPVDFRVDDAWKELWQIFMTTFLNSKELLEEIKKE